jgi:hypothetical protein
MFILNPTLVYLILCSICYVSDTVEEVYPNYWSEQASGSYVYNYQLSSTPPRTFNLSLNGTSAGNYTVSGVGPAPSFAFLNPSPLMIAGQSVSLQLHSGTDSFASLAGNGTGWRIQVVHPDGSAPDLGLMADWRVSPGGEFSWNFTVPGSYLTQVGQLCSLHRHAQACTGRWAVSTGPVKC